MPETIRVLCVDDHAFLAEGLRSKLELERDMEFVGWLADANGLAREVEERQPDVVTVDIEMPGADPFEAVKDMSRRSPNTKAIMLSAYVRDTYIDAAVAAGAWGYLAKSDDPDHIVDAIRQVAGGEFVLGPGVEARALVPAKRKREKPSSRSQLLTAREQQILRMIGKGLSRTEIAKELFRSSKTVDAHQQSIMKKLGIHDRVDLVRYAIREGLVEP